MGDEERREGDAGERHRAPGAGKRGGSGQTRRSMGRAAARRRRFGLVCMDKARSSVGRFRSAGPLGCEAVGSPQPQGRVGLHVTWPPYHLSQL